MLIFKNRYDQTINIGYVDGLDFSMLFRNRWFKVVLNNNDIEITDLENLETPIEDIKEYIKENINSNRYIFYLEPNDICYDMLRLEDV